MQWLKYVYCLFFVMLTLGVLRIVWIASRRNRKAILPDVPTHAGSTASSDSLFFVAPPPEIGLLRSAQSTLTENARMDLGDVIATTIAGALFGYAAAWSFAVSENWMAYLLVGLTAFITSYVALHRAGKHCCSFVGADGIYDVVARVYRDATPIDGMNESWIPFDKVTDIYVRPTVSLIFERIEQNWKTPFKEGVFQRIPPHSVSLIEWNAFHKAAKTAFEDHLWSRALLQLAISKLIDRKDPSAPYMTPEAGFRAMLTANISESGFLPNEGLYQPDESGEFYWRVGCGGITFTLHSLLIYSRDADVFESTGLSQAELSPEQVNRASVEEGALLIETDSDGVFSVPIQRCSQASVLVRLIHSAIWAEGIEAQIQKELQHDIDALTAAGWPTSFAEVPYWTVIPGHRYAIWHAAEILKLTPPAPGFANVLKLQTGYKSGNPCYAFWLFFPDQFSGWQCHLNFEYETRLYLENREEYLKQLFRHDKMEDD